MPSETYIDRIPRCTLESLRAYVETGGPTGGFLRAVLINDLADAVCRADEGNSKALKEIVWFVYNECPSNCWGNAVRVNQWLDRENEETQKLRERYCEMDAWQSLWRTAKAVDHVS